MSDPEEPQGDVRSSIQLEDTASSMGKKVLHWAIKEGAKRAPYYVLTGLIWVFPGAVGDIIIVARDVIHEALNGPGDV
jgi:hypothetical protein